MQEVVVMAVRAAVMEDPLPSSPFMGRSLGYAHAGGDAQRGEDGGQDGDGRLDDVFPSFSHEPRPVVFDEPFFAAEACELAAVADVPSGVVFRGRWLRK